MGLKDGRDVLEKRKISFLYRDSSPGPFRQYNNNNNNNNNKYLLPLTSNWRAVKPSPRHLTIHTYDRI